MPSKGFALFHLFANQEGLKLPLAWARPGRAGASLWEPEEAWGSLGKTEPARGSLSQWEELGPARIAWPA